MHSPGRRSSASRLHALQCDGPLTSNGVASSGSRAKLSQPSSSARSTMSRARSSTEAGTRVQTHVRRRRPPAKSARTVTPPSRLTPSPKLRPGTPDPACKSAARRSRRKVTVLGGAQGHGAGGERTHNVVAGAVSARGNVSRALAAPRTAVSARERDLRALTAPVHVVCVCRPPLRSSSCLPRSEVPRVGRSPLLRRTKCRPGRPTGARPGRT